MTLRSESVTLVGDTATVARALERYGPDQLAVRQMASIDALEEDESDSDPGAVVVAASDEESVRTVVDTVPAGVPVVAFLPENGVDTPLALAAGATEAVTPDDHPTLVARRLRRLLTCRPESSRPSNTVDSKVLETLEAILSWTVGDGELIALVTAGFRHQAVAGESFESPLEAATLEGATVREAFSEWPAVRAQIESLYAATFQGDAHGREVGLRDRTYRVETYPVSVTSEPVCVVRFVPVSVDRTRRITDAEVRRKVRRLHDIATALDDVDVEGEIFELAVESASRVLEFDACSIGEREDGRIVARAATASQLSIDFDQLGATEGVAGKTIESGETIIVDDVASEPDAQPAHEAFQSAVSIPVGDSGVFQAVSTSADGFSDRDRMLAELLVTHVTNALKRVRYQAALTVERDHFAALFENVPDPALRYRRQPSGELTVRAINSAFVRVFGREPASIVEGRVSSLLAGSEAGSTPEALTAKIAAGNPIDTEVTGHTADGTRPFLLRSVPVGSRPDVDGPEGYLIFTDLTELKRRERELLEKTERLDRFASVVSHDLRNPLSVAQGYLEHVRDTGDLDFLEQIERGHDRAFAIIDDVLELARQGADVETVDTELISLEAVAERAWAGVETQDVAIEIGPGGDAKFEAVPGRCRQLFENLYRNSIEHGMPPATDDDFEERNPEGSEPGALETQSTPSLTVTVNTFENGFYVADDGVGFNPEKRESLFEYGYTSSPDGTGLGLAIVREIAEAHDWSITAAESEAGGARFEVYVPEMAADR
ncbi:ATP-binding protein [Halobacteria archaeon AArc-curdl1]|uniref:histidine kinase n=1 Tax=Natronosalvus hydrolyticus TaxID=2979988 RepID=A0AAP3E793_9EURY|nr:ATP-binding protein [Halobacteria archaeon AArc-curdl1]